MDEDIIRGIVLIVIAAISWFSAVAFKNITGLDRGYVFLPLYAVLLFIFVKFGWIPGWIGWG